MPATWDLPRQSGMWDVVDIDRFNRLPVYCHEQTTKELPTWTRWQSFLGTVDWEANMGDTMQGVIAEMPPVTKQYHNPNYITSAPLKTVVSHYERGNTARVKRHLFESPLINFRPSFRDFRKKQIPTATKALNKIIGCGLDMFLRWQVLQQSPRVYVVDNTTSGGDPIVGAPAGEANETSSPKDTSWFQAMGQLVGSNTGFLNFRNIVAVRDTFRRDIGAVPWDGVPAIPKENETMKGKWLLVGEGSLYEALGFDDFVLNYKDYAVNLINSPFRGIIQGDIAFMEERYPLRFKEDGTLPEPELEQQDGVTYPTGNTKGNETIPNPDYVNAPFAVAFLLGYQPYESIKVGPPPSEFAGGSIKMGKYHQLNWNGEIRLTDDVLVNYGDVMDTNKYGEFLQLICDTTLGIIANTPRFCLPIIYRSNKRPSLNFSPA